MEILKIALIFAVIIVAIKYRAPLWLAVLLATVATGLLFALPPVEFVTVAAWSAISRETLTLLAVVYILTYLQKQMSRRQMLQKAERLTTGLLQNRRLSVAISPAIMGLLPAPGSVLMAGEMVQAACKEHMTREDMAFVTSFFRHIPESALPTYSAVVAALAVSGVPAGRYMLWMLPPIAVMAITPYWMHLRRIPKEADLPRGDRVLRDIGLLLYYLWPVFVTILLILAAGWSPLPAAGLVAVLFTAVSRFPLKEIWAALRASLEVKTLAGMWLIMIFKDVFTATGAAGRMPEALSALPVPAFIIFGLIFFLGAIIGSKQAMIPLIMPMAFAATGEQLAMMVFLMTLGHLGSQFSPTHVCLPLCCEYYGVRFSDIVRRTVPVGLICTAFACGYYLLMAALT